MNLQKLYNPLMELALRSPLHGLLSGSTMLVTVTGRKSGKAYTTPVNYLRDGEALITVSRRERTWWRNLHGGAPVTVRMKGQDLKGVGEVLEDDNAVAASLRHYLELIPQYAKYFDVRLDPGGKPNGDDVARAARSRVMIAIRLS